MITTKEKILKIEILFIFLISISLRFYRLGSLPKAFFTDEMALGYNGWSLLSTGKDEWGQTLPLVLRSFDDYKPGIYSYLTIPGIVLLGLSQMTARLPAAIFGSLLPLFAYFLFKKFIKNENIALLSSFVIAVSPWHIEISRTAIEAGVALSLSIFSLFLFKKLKESKIKYFIISCLSLAILYTYHSARLIYPVLLLSSLFIQKKAKKKKIILALLVLIAGLGLSFYSSKERFAQISIFNDRHYQLIREESIREDGMAENMPLLLTRVFHNKIWSMIYAGADSYLTNISLKYLFMGGAQPPRATIPQTGQFLLIFLPFFLLGIIYSLRKNERFDHWLLFWLIIAPIPAALTTAEIPHTYRTIYLIPVVALYIAYGIFYFYQLGLKTFKNINFMKKVYPLCFCTTFILTTTYFTARAWHQYRVHQQLHQPWHRQYGYEELINQLNKLEKAEQITITNRENEPYMAVLFYNKIQPKEYQKLEQKRLSHIDIEAGAETWSMWQYTFSEQPCPHDTTDTNPHNYYVVLPTCELPPGFEQVSVINFKDGNAEFRIDHPVDAINVSDKK